MTENPSQAGSLPLPRPPSLIGLDFDGVMTDNRVIVLEDGREAVACDRSDGLGIGRLRQLYTGPTQRDYVEIGQR